MGVANSRKSSNRTAYQLVIADMLNRIRQGMWRVNERIPTLDELATIYPYSRMTVVRAVRELVDEGYLHPRGKKGTVVLKTGTRQVIGLLARYNFAFPERARFAHTLASLLREHAERAGFDVHIYQEEDDIASPEYPSKALLSAVAEEKLAGLIAVTSNLMLWRKTFQCDCGLPTVEIGYYPGNYRVFLDYRAAISQALGLAKAQGCQSAGLMSNLPDALPVFCAEAKQMGLETVDNWLLHRPDMVTELAGYETFKEVWRNPSRPKAILIMDDVAAKGVAQAVAALGIDVPGQLRLFVLANKGLNLFYPCPVTRIEFDPEDIAATGVGLLRELLQNASLPPRQLLVTPCAVNINGTHGLECSAAHEHDRQ